MARIVCLAAIAALVTVLSGAGSAAELVSHRAVYTTTLHSAARDSGITAVNGEMAVDWSRTCAGWTFEHRSLIDVSFSAHAPLRQSTNATSWESEDGREYRFSIRKLTNGKVTDKVEGVARLVAPGGSGSVLFTAPKRDRMALPAGTMFPLEHSIVMLDQASQGVKLVTRTVFDGMSFDGPFEISAALGMPATHMAPTTDKAKGDVGTAALAGRRYWPVQFAFFPVGSFAAAPETEVGMRMYDNGVSDRLLISYRDFTLFSRLSKLEILDPPACG